MFHLARETEESGEEEYEYELVDDPEDCQEMSIDDAIDQLGMGLFQYRILLASGLCFAADAMEVLLLSFLSAILKEEWSLSANETAFITSTLFAGAIFGALILGPWADHIGRRVAFSASVSILACSGLASAAAPNYVTFLFIIFAVGFGVGGLTVPFDTYAEFLPSKGRGKNLLAINYFWTGGCILVVIVAYGTIGRDIGNWRLFVGLCTIPCFLSLLCAILLVPESPRWLCAEGRPGEALMILRSAAVINGHQDVEAMFPFGLRLTTTEANESASVCDLFQPQWRAITLRLWGSWAGFAFGYYGAIMAITTVFDSDSQQQGEDTVNFDFGAIFIDSSAELLGCILTILVVDWVGRISSQIFCYGVAGTCLCALCFLASSGAPRYLLIGLGFVVRTLEMGGTGVSWAGTAEILTTDIRSTGHSSANAMARLGAFFSPLVVQGDLSLVKVGLFMFAVHMFTVFCVSGLPETKGRAMGVVEEAVSSPDPPVSWHDALEQVVDESEPLVDTSEGQFVGLS